ncbi:Porin-like protein NicP precursor [Pseudomonas oleovorans subsp. oleovorans]|uniref:Outer membrane porin n=1 Tax=Ectopseudomonas oleovorans TaxID=301 RepID=A0A379K082_ECTOL|nr:OprD family porin [Pseudomonas oleovorans]OWK44722.1 Porin-like protein NicP precursor [Pseudomonas oleovorans subsp. oleovorans]SEJ92507.1 outer membrane porin, OprD family [Pseudomonas oleovorans]SUD53841.1 outer membrane porin [Pseudomonas oleovorans]
MSKTPLARAVALATLGASLTLPSLAQADFIGDSKATLELRNFYMNRDLRDPGVAQSKREEWAQGFILKAESGFTEGTVGFGLDAYAGLGLKLDSSDERAATGLLPNAFGNEGPDEYSELSGAVKARISKTVGKVGGLMPKLPIVSSGDSRLLPQVFTGGMITSQEIDGLTLNGGQLREVNFRNSTDRQDISATNYTSAASPRDSDRYNFAGGDYKFNGGNTTVGLWYGELEDIYDQKLYNLIHVQPIGDWKLGANLAYFDSQNNGSRRAGKIDNNLTSVNLWAGIGAHTFRLGYQKVSGHGAFPFLNETDPYIVNYIQILDFTREDEKSWQARYDVNFASYGIPGLTAFVRYVTGDGFDGMGGASGKEWERDVDISYVIQQGPLKNLGVRWRNAMVRSNANIGDLDENRLIVSTPFR